MSTAGTTSAASPVTGARRRLPKAGLPRVLLSISVLIVLLSIIAAITGADDLTSSGTIGAALALAVPIGLAGLGGLWAERAAESVAHELHQRSGRPACVVVANDACDEELVRFG